MFACSEITGKLKAAVKRHFVVRKSAAIMLLSAMLLPVALPVPAFAFAEKTPEQKFADSLFESPTPLEPTVPNKNFSASPLAFLSDLFGEASDVTSERREATDAAEKEAEKAAENATNREILIKRIKRIEIALDAVQTIRIDEVLALSAVPFDEKEMPVDGIIPEWKSSNAEVLFINNERQAIARAAGRAELTVRAGRVENKIAVTVLAGKGENSRAKTKPNAGDESALEKQTTQTPDESGQETKTPANNAGGATLKSLPAAQQGDQPIRPELGSDAEVNSLFAPENNVGSPPNRTEPSAPTRAVAARTKERAGIGNFSFGIPVASLPGRGINASVGISYNSRLWNKYSYGEDNNSFTFNADGNWLAPGFQIGFGYLDMYTSGDGSLTLTSPDGTRHKLAFVGSNSSTQQNIYESIDGTYIETQTPFNNYHPANMTVHYSDGTKVVYGTHNSQYRRFPISMTDRNGNVINITYITGDANGKIANIVDTLGRYITFHYDATTERKLVAVSVPDFGTSGARRQTIRFYYEDLTLFSPSGRFNGTVTAPASIKTLKYVYFPATQSGYRYDYSASFGFIYKITQLRSMQISQNVANAESLTNTGTVTNEGTWAASTLR